MLKNTLLLFWILFTVFTDCRSQSLSNKKLNVKNKHKIDKATFNKYELLKRNKSAQFMSKDGFLISFIELDSVYQIEKQRPTSPFKTVKVYDKAGNLTVSGYLFYDISIGKTTLYDLNGNILSQTNENAEYAFSVTQLIKKIRNDFKIDISVIDPDISVDQNIEDHPTPTPTYIIRIKKANFMFRELLINGTTGVLISDKVIFSEELFPRLRRVSLKKGLGYGNIFQTYK
nr:hypothetical protein [uncultured Mucilaginibacter sp.]